MYRGELRLQAGENLLWQCSPRPEPPEERNKAVLAGSPRSSFVSLGQTTFAAVLAVFGLVSGGWSEYSRRRHADLVE
ncbi:hypothetical protein [Amycolatopsis sp. NBC_01286]|uniref:hypothetical protein n=1 Tax=Amycolatopsis sp. NBC_01286 TaxID=2903560 RepID=UPI002E0DB0F9|nr:hypothetical protein OG570_19655 [Amycolatopsis sp. NBC_01286]